MSKAFNLDSEFGSFLDLVVNNLDNDFEKGLIHTGVKGMKWGVRRSESGSSGKTKTELKTLGPDTIVRKTKSGDTVTLTKVPPPPIARLLSKMSSGYRESVGNFANFTISDSSGKSIGDAQLTKKSSEELNVIWVGVKNSERGKGYATAVMKGAQDFGRQEGVKKLTLEVPGDSPDARHIYEKLGFKDKGRIDDDDGVWGGLTAMEYTYDSVKHQDVDDFLAHFGVKGMRWGKKKAVDRAEGYSDKAVGRDMALYGVSGSQRINKRMSEGADLKTARRKELNRQVGTGLAIGTLGSAVILGPAIGRMTMGALSSSASAAAAKRAGKTAANQLLTTDYVSSLAPSKIRRGAQIVTSMRG